MKMDTVTFKATILEMGLRGNEMFPPFTIRLSTIVQLYP